MFHLGAIRKRFTISYQENFQDLFIPGVIGLITGLFIVVFVRAIEFSTKIFLGNIVGYIPPLPAGEGGSTVYHFVMARPYLLPLSVAIGGLIVGVITYLVPEARGEGTEMAIKAFHFRLPLGLKSAVFKLITSAITIGSGGVSGTEGPSALIGGSVGSFVGKLFKLDDHTKNIALAVGLGAGIAGVFKAPLAGALISGELFYRRDFEVEALIPGFIASVTSYIIVGVFTGFEHMFKVPVHPFKGLSVPLFVTYFVMGVLAALVARLLVYTFFSVHHFFVNLELHPALKPAIGGFFTGILGMLNPLAIGSAYGWIQLIMLGKTHYLTPLHIFTGVIMVIVGLSLTLGSGGSGGIFGPCIVIGGLTGASFYHVAKFLSVLPQSHIDIASFMIVGMIATLAAAANIPLSTLILVVEITGGYDLLVPSLIAVSVAYLLTTDITMFPAQVKSRIDSPAHMDELKGALLRTYRVADIMTKNVVTISPTDPVLKAERLMAEYTISGIPVVVNGKVIGMVTGRDIMKVPISDRAKVTVEHVMSRNPVCVLPDMSILEVLNIFISNGIGRAPVVDNYKNKNLIGMITRVDIANFLAEQERKKLAEGHDTTFE
ncbi:chloride channel protein [Desulfurobacterium sp.]|uniref:chloride channel protein n=1 Tax=Desulfurobacterium sp. TaxID=2004706 RepID=UPI002607B473|nr:chloride channel protein [Desulfurobacterium sp.]